MKTWLTRHPELFSRADSERFKLASMDVDILCGLASRWLPDENAVIAAARGPGIAADRLQDRVAVEIAELLKREGPLPIGRIRSHLYGRFIGHSSADAVIAQHPHQFVRERNGTVKLRTEADPFTPENGEAVAPIPKRTAFWQRR